MIYTLTLNPALDYVIHIGDLQIGKTNRTLSEEISFGGKGINVSVVLSRLGVETTALGIVGGFIGEALEDAVSRLGVNADFVRLETGNTRINVKLICGGTETEINAGGPCIEEVNLERLYEKLNTIEKEDTLVLSGSVPASLPSGIYGDIMERLCKKGTRIAVDAAGDALIRTLEYKPFLIKPNLSELEDIFKRNFSSETEIENAAKELKDMGAVNVLVSLGKNGALLIDKSGEVRRKKAADGKAVVTAGAGDSMMAGFLAGLSGGYEYALALGVAAGCATAFSSGLASREHIISIVRSFGYDDETKYL